MKVLKCCTWAVSIVCVVALVAACTAVSPVTTPSRFNGQQFASMKNMNSADSGFAKNATHAPGFENVISTLTAAGYDTTELAALIKAGDRDKIKAWMDAFNTAHPGVLPTPKGRPDGGKGKFCDSNMTANLVSTVKAAGYDTTELAALIAAGDCDKVKTWMDTFNTAHPGVLPTHQGPPGEGKGGANLVSMIEKAGYDTTELSALLKAGDRDKIKAWMDAFNTAHPGVLPTPPVKK